MKKLKLDLHTHCGEALRTHMPKVDDVRSIVQSAKRKGLDGLGITEHYDRDFGFRVKAIVEKEFGGQLIILPGWEIDKGQQQIVELYLTDQLIFRFMAHPTNTAKMIPGIAGIEVENDQRKHYIARELGRKIAVENDLIMLTNSDAHDMGSVGALYNEISFEDLIQAAQRQIGI